MQKILIILRHAKAEMARPGQDDHARRLTERGREDAARMGEYMRAHGLAPQKILCSTAVRTRETYELAVGSWQLASGGGGLPDAECHLLDALYNASEKQLLQIIAGQAEEVSSLMLIGHNPGLHQLALRLSGNDERVAEFPTCALAVIHIEEGWRDIRKAPATLIRLTTPGGI